jgi:hypothetical protein
VNVLRLLILTTPLLISGCASFSLFGDRVKPVEIQTKAVERQRLDLNEPAPIKAREIKWILITPQNADKVFNDLKQQNVDLVLFAITDEGYEQLALTMAEIRNYIAAQRAIIVKYKEYYEPPTVEKK